MARSIREIEQELETLRKDEADLRQNKDHLMSRLSTDPSVRKSLDVTYQLMSTVLNSQHDKIEEIKVLKEREKETVQLSKKRQRFSLPPPTCGSDWTDATLAAYSISFRSIDQLNEFLFQSQRPSKSNRAIQFEDACSNISDASLRMEEFPTDCNAQWFAKHLYGVITGKFGNLELNVDDMVIALFHSLGFNNGNLLTTSRKKLDLYMSNGKTTAEADVTVFNLSNMLQLVVVKDKRYSGEENANDGEAQLVAGAIAGSMYNRKRIARITQSVPRCRAISESSIVDSAVTSKLINDITTVSDIPLFMIRFYGPNVSFYSHRFDDKLLDCVAYKEVTTTFTQIQQYAPIINGNPTLELYLLASDDRKIIIETLDAIRQILEV